MMDALKPSGKPLDGYIGIYNSPAWPDEGIQLPIELGEAIYSGKRLFIRYINKDGEITERWVSPQKVIGLTDYVYLQAYCHSRQADRGGGSWWSRRRCPFACAPSQQRGSGTQNLAAGKEHPVMITVDC